MINQYKLADLIVSGFNDDRQTVVSSDLTIFTQDDEGNMMKKMYTVDFSSNGDYHWSSSSKPLGDRN